MSLRAGARWCPALATALLLGAAARPGAVRADWHAAQPVSMPGLEALAISPSVAFDAPRHATVAWTELDDLGLDYRVKASTLSLAGGTWSTPVALSPPGRYAGDPVLVTSGRGAAAILWDADLESQAGVRRVPFVAATLGRAGGGWSRPQRVSPRGVVADQAMAGMDARGAITAAWVAEWRRGSQIETAIETASRGPGHAFWSRPATLATLPGSGIGLYHPQLAVGARGDAVAVWMRPRSGGIANPAGLTDEVFAAVRRGGRWSRPVSLGSEFEPGGQASATTRWPGPRVAMDDAGDAVAVWQRRRGGRVISEACMVRRHARAWRCGAVAGVSAFDQDVAVDGRGDATVVWEGSDGAVSVASRSIAHPSRWSAPRTIARSRTAAPAHADVAVGPGGAAVVCWEGDAVRAAVRPGPHAAWRKPVMLGAGGVPRAAVDPAGDAVVAWQRPDPGIAIDAAVYTPGG